MLPMMRQQLSTLADFGKTEHRENDGQRYEPAASVLKCIVITILG